jgi:hypothetical protein
MGLYTAGQCEHDPARALAQIYADPAGATPVVQPLCSDAYGNVEFFAAQNIYTLVYRSP